MTLRIHTDPFGSTFIALSLALLGCSSSADCPPGTMPEGGACVKVAADDGGMGLDAGRDAELDGSAGRDGAGPDGAVDDAAFGDADVPSDAAAGDADTAADAGAEDAASPPADGCTPRTFYRDADEDGYGTPSLSIMRCAQPDGYVDNADDCDDDCMSCHPEAEEVCDGKDNDCNGDVDDGVTTTFYRDADGDDYGDPGSSMEACEQPEGYVENDDDCHDGNDEVHPDADFHTEPIPGTASDYDWNCDGNESAQFTRHAGCSDGYTGFGCSDGWLEEDGDIPDCGDGPRTFRTCSSFMDMCNPVSDDDLVQPCR